MTQTSMIPVTADNFVGAESDLYFAGIGKDGGFGKFMSSCIIANRPRSIIRR